MNNGEQIKKAKANGEKVNRIARLMYECMEDNYELLTPCHIVDGWDELPSFVQAVIEDITINCLKTINAFAYEYDEDRVFVQSSIMITKVISDEQFDEYARHKY